MTEPGADQKILSAPSSTSHSRETQLVSTRELDPTDSVESHRLEQIVSSLIDPRCSASQLLERDETVLQLRIDSSQRTRLREALRHIDPDRVSDLREATLAALDPLAFLSELLSINVVGIANDSKGDRYALETDEGDLFWIGSMRQILSRGHLATILVERHGVFPTIDKDCQPKLLMLALQWAPRTRTHGNGLDHSHLYVEHLLRHTSRKGEFPVWEPTSPNDPIEHPVFRPGGEDSIFIHLPTALEYIRKYTTHEPRQPPIVEELKSRRFVPHVYTRRLTDGIFQLRGWKSDFPASEWKPSAIGNVEGVLNVGKRGGYPR